MNQRCNLCGCVYAGMAGDCACTNWGFMNDDVPEEIKPALKRQEEDGMAHRRRLNVSPGPRDGYRYAPAPPRKIRPWSFVWLVTADGTHLNVTWVLWGLVALGLWIGLG